MNTRFDFDKVVNRRNGDSYKWNKFASAGPDVIGAWVADMDFCTPPAVVEALQKRLNGPALGYSDLPDELVAVVLERLQRLYGWRVDPSWLVVLSGVVPGMFGAARVMGGAGDGLITQSPNYHHFFKAAQFSDRRLMRLRNSVVNDRWEMDFDHLQQLANEGAKGFMLCNPHNPVGRILTREELQQVADICLAKNLVICSDEIHADLLLDEDKPHIPIATLSPEAERCSITLVSPTKTFNLPGIGGFALAIIPNPELRAQFEKQVFGVVPYPTVLAYEAALVSYRDCNDWSRQLLRYLRGNRDALEQRVAAMPGVEMTHVEATYLAWINVEALGLDEPVNHFLEYGVALSAGADMGDANYLRLNFGCPRTTLEEILARMDRAIAALSLDR